MTKSDKVLPRLWVSNTGSCSQSREGRGAVASTSKKEVRYSSGRASNADENSEHRVRRPLQIQNNSVRTRSVVS